jgi:FixJ family two-component response regulator
MTGIELAEKLTADKKDVLFTLLVGNADAPVAVKAMQENTLDFVLKPVSSESLLGLVARAYAQYYDVDWDFVGENLDFIEDSLNRISTRDREVLELLVDGNSSREIASLLGVSTKTIEAHRARINDKMRSDDLPHLIRMMMVYNDDSER